MATILAIEQYVQQLDSNLQFFSTIDPETLLRTELGIDFNFVPAKAVFERLHLMASRLLTLELRKLPADMLDKLGQSTKQLKQTCSAIQTFSSSGGNALEQRNRVLGTLADQEGPFYSIASSLLCYEEQVKGEVNELVAGVREAKALLDKNLSETERSLEAARLIAAETAVTAYAGFFGSEASSFRLASRKWMIATIGLAAVTGALAAHSVWNAPMYAALQPSASIQLAIAKLLLFSVLYFALVWCGRVYRAHKHNEVVSRHRETALKCFAAFVSAAGEDAQVKNAVLLQTCAAIFGPQATGFITAETEPGSPQILEIVREFGNRAAKS